MTSRSPVGVIPAGPEHAAAIAAIYAPVVTDTAISFESVPPDTDEVRRRMLASSLPWYVAESGGTVVGYAHAAPFKGRDAYQHTVETSVYVAAGARGAGVGRALLQQLLSDLAVRGTHLAVATIALPNDGSVAAAEFAGFTHAGTLPEAGFKHGRWIDVGLWVRRF